MKKFHRSLLILFFVFNLITPAAAQTVDRIKSYFDKILVSQVDSINLLLNDSVSSALINHIKTIDPVKEDIPDLKYLGQITSPDSLVKIFSWNIPLFDGDNLYNCIIYSSKSDTIIQMKGNTGIPGINEDEVCSHENWYGALYYDIETMNAAEDKVYVLLGFDPDNVHYNSKVIEILSFDENNSPLFGKKLFSVDGKTTSRMIFRYSPLAVMMLKFDEARDRIVFDHLSPSSPQYDGQYRYYGPDFSYDALELKDGKLILIKEIEYGREEIQ